MFKKFFTKNSNLSTEDQELIKRYADTPELAEELAERMHRASVIQSEKKALRHERRVRIARKLALSLLLFGTILGSFCIGRFSQPVTTTIHIPYGHTYNIKYVKSIAKTPSGNTIVLTYDGKIYNLFK